MRKPYAVLSILLLCLLPLAAQTGGTRPPAAPPPAVQPAVQPASQPTAAKGGLVLVDLFTKAPTVTFAFEGGGETNLRSARALGRDSDFLFKIIDPMTMSGNSLWARPSLGLAWNGLEIKTTATFDQGGVAEEFPYLGGDNGFWTGDVVLDGEARYSLGPLNFSEHLYYDAGDGTAAVWYENLSATFKAGNLSAGFSTFADYDRTASFLIFNGSFDGYVVGDAWLSAEKLFGGLDIKIGGIDARYLRLRSLFFEPEPIEYFSKISKDLGFLAKPNFLSQYRDLGMLQVRTTTSVGAANPWTMDPSAVAQSAQYSLGAFTFYEGASLPMGAPVNFQEWLRQNNLKLGARYELKGIGSFDAGWDVGLGYTRANEIVGPSYIEDNKHLGNNSFWLDADLKLIQGLDLRTGLDLTLMPYTIADGFNGTGIITDPYSYDYGNGYVANIGVEVRYGLEKVLKGLSGEAGVYGALFGGKTYDDLNVGTVKFSDFLDATYPKATYFRMDSLNEQSYLRATSQYGAGAPAPLALYLAGDYRLNDSWAFKLSDQLKLDAYSVTGLYAGAVLTPIGYYSLDLLELGTRYTEGSFVFSLDLGWHFALGLPSAGDLDIDKAVAQAAGYSNADEMMKDLGPFGTGSGRAPWIVKAGVKVKL